MEPLIVSGNLPDQPTVQVQNTTIHLGFEQILNQISFAVKPGTLCVLLGPNGAGKTTLLRCIGRLITQTSGRIYINGQDTAALGRKELASRLAYVPQIHQGVFSYTVKDFVLLGRTPHLSLFGTPKEADDDLADKALVMLGISHLSDRNYLQLSGGERQLVLLARGLVQQAQVMLLDEPTAHLDYSHQHHIMGTIKGLVQKSNLAALVTLHDPNLALEYGDQIILLARKKIIADLCPQDSDYLDQFEAGLKHLYDYPLQIWRNSKRAVVVKL